MTWKHEGSVSSGTLRERDLIPAFFGALLRVAPDRAGELGRGYGYNPELSDSWMESAGSDAQGEFLCGLDAMLNEAAPDTHYFGTLEGDGSAFGFWPIED